MAKITVRPNIPVTPSKDVKQTQQSSSKSESLKFPPLKEKGSISGKSVSDKGRPTLTLKKVSPIMVKRNQEYTGIGNVKIEFKTDAAISNKERSGSFQTTITPFSKGKSAMCLTKEEVRGQKIESTIEIANPSAVANLNPGCLFSARDFINNPEHIEFIEVKNRKPFNLTINASDVKRATARVNAVPGEDVAGKIRIALNELKDSDNFKVWPNLNSEPEMIESTHKETTKVKIAASASFMGINAEDQFGFKNEHSTHMYIFSYKHDCFSIGAEQVTSPGDLFVNAPSNLGNDWCYVSEVIYGRRIYVVIESEYSLDSYYNIAKAKIDWEFFKAKFESEVEHKSVDEICKVRVVTKGGTPVPITGFKDIPKEIDKALNANPQNLLPVAIKVTNLEGKPVSLVTEAFLDTNRCITTHKVKVYLKKLLCTNVDDGNSNDGTEQVYGSIYVYTPAQKGVEMVKGQGTGLPTYPGYWNATKNFSTHGVWLSIIPYAKQKATINLRQDTPVTWENSPELKDKEVSLNFENLDTMIYLYPTLSEYDTSSADDVFETNERFCMSIREILLGGHNEKTFVFSHEDSRIEMTIGIGLV